MATESGIALGTWSWGTGANGGDKVFGNHKSEAELKAVFDEAMAQGLNLWAELGGKTHRRPRKCAT